MSRVDHQSTKIIATVGPNSNSYAKLLELARAGADVFRLNFSHGSHDDHRKVIEHVSYLREKYNYHIGLLADLQGPKIRIGDLQEEEIVLEQDKTITFVNTPCLGTSEKVYMLYEAFPGDAQPGERVLLDDGKIVLSVEESNGVDAVVLKVIHGGVLRSKKGVNLPDTVISQPSLTEKDRADLEFILTRPEINWIALSFVRSAQDIRDLRKLVEDAGHSAKLIAKIEKPEALSNINKIIKESNGIMIARGDLGVEVEIERIPSIQKMIISKCIQRARPVIVATQMMESMIENPSPTRAEVTDVANAVLDGCDAVMLSAETAIGKHPVAVVQAMNRIIEEAEKHYAMAGRRPKPSPKSSTFLSDVVIFNAAKTGDEVSAKALIGLTVSGYTAFKLSSYRPSMKIYIFSSFAPILSTLSLVWGVHGFYYDRFTTTDGTIDDVTRILKGLGRVKNGDVVVNLGSMPIEKRFRTNMMKVTIID